MENRPVFFLPPEGIAPPRVAERITIITYPSLIDYLPQIASKYITEPVTAELRSPLKPDRVMGILSENTAVLAFTPYNAPTPAPDSRYISLCPPLKEAGDELLPTLRLLEREKNYRLGEADRLRQARLAVESHISALMSPLLPPERLIKRADGIISREIPKKGGVGRAEERYIEAMTPDGYVRLYSTVEGLADRIYDIEDRCGLGEAMMERLAQAALNRGYDCILCLSPGDKRLLHLIIPELRLAFVTSDRRAAYHGKTHRRVRLDGYLGAASSEDKAACRALARFCRDLDAEATRMLTAASALADKIDSLITAHVDAKAVKKLISALE